MRTESP